MPEDQPAADCPENPEAEVLRLRARVAEQATQIAELLQRIQALEARLAKDSHNSSKPPSSDPPPKKPPPRALRQPSGKKPGGQKDHPGATRTLVDTPERTVVIALAGRCPCGHDLCRGSPSRNCPNVARSRIWRYAARSPSIGQ